MEGKVVMLGEPAVGKSSLVNVAVHQVFNEDIESTIGGAFYQLGVQTQEGPFTLKIWDTAGQQQFRSFARIYYRDAKGAMLVLDLTRRKTLEAVLGWVLQLKEHGPPDLMLFLLGNKQDLFDSYEVSYEECIALSKQINASFYMVSAKDGSNVAQVFCDMAQRISSSLPLRTKQLAQQQKQAPKELKLGKRTATPQRRVCCN